MDPWLFHGPKNPKCTVSFNHQRGCTYWWLKETSYSTLMGTFLLDQFGSPKFQLFKSKLWVQKGPYPISVHARECCIFPVSWWRHTVKHLWPTSDMEWLSFYPSQKSTHIQKNAFTNTLVSKCMVTKIKHKKHSIQGLNVHALRYLSFGLTCLPFKTNKPFLGRAKKHEVWKACQPSKCERLLICD